jgi:hypothetical protein
MISFAAATTRPEHPRSRDDQQRPGHRRCEKSGTLCTASLAAQQSHPPKDSTNRDRSANTPGTDSTNSPIIPSRMRSVRPFVAPITCKHERQGLQAGQGQGR